MVNLTTLVLLYSLLECCECCKLLPYLLDKGFRGFTPTEMKKAAFAFLVFQVQQAETGEVE
jgi:hypothetical protein